MKNNLWGIAGIHRVINALCLAVLLSGLWAAILPTFAEAKIPLDSTGLPTLAPMLERAVPAVVNIAVRGSSQTANSQLFNDPFFRRFFGAPPAEREFSGSGSGVIIDAKAGLVLSNHHVINKAAEIKVLLDDGREIDAELLGSDAATDIALLKIDSADLRLSELQLGDSDGLRVGDFVVAVGNPFGFRQTVTMGIVSAKGRSGLGRGFQDFIQTDASINPGNSGGALINLRGELVGINSAIYSKSGGNIGIGFAIPVNLVKRVVAQLQEYGGVQRGLLGIVGQDIDQGLAEAFGLERAQGVIVTRVQPNSPAERAGLRVEDVILTIDGDEVGNLEALRNRIGLLHVGDGFNLRLLRGGKVRTVAATLTAPEPITQAGEKLHRLLAGTTVQEDILAGTLTFSRVKKRSAAFRAGVRRGDKILAINRNPVSRIAQLPRLLDPRYRRLGFAIGRNGEQYYVVVE